MIGDVAPHDRRAGAEPLTVGSNLRDRLSGKTVTAGLAAGGWLTCGDASRKRTVLNLPYWLSLGYVEVR